MLDDLQTADLPAGRVRYLDLGPRDTRDVLVLVHGFPLGVRMWAPQLEAFPRWRLIVPALPGFDGSDPVDPRAAQLLAGLVVASFGEGSRGDPPYAQRDLGVDQAPSWIEGSAVKKTRQYLVRINRDLGSDWGASS